MIPAFLPVSKASMARERKMTYALAHSSRPKVRRWPLVLRFTKGAIHKDILFPIFVHTVITGLVVYIDKNISKDLNLPNSIIPSLSIVVGLMLVFRNQTAYQRFWNGRLHVNTVTTAIRCLGRTILVLSPGPKIRRRGSEAPLSSPPPLKRATTCSLPDINYTFEAQANEEKQQDEARVVEIVKILIAMLYTIKNHLRTDWGVALSPGTCITNEGQETTDEAYAELLPEGLKGWEHRGLALTLELSVFVEAFVGFGVHKGWFHNAAAATMLGRLNDLTQAYGNMETIRLTPIPVAHLIHHQQTLAIYCIFLSFATASEMGWWALPLVAFVAFTLYGIEGIAHTFEDPFGISKIDIAIDDIVEDTRREIELLLEVWQTQNHNVDSPTSSSEDKPRQCRMFVPNPNAILKQEILFGDTEIGSARTSHSSGMTSSLHKSGAESKKTKGHVRWTSSAAANSTQNKGLGMTISPGTVVEDMLEMGAEEQEAIFGARRMTWGTDVGGGDLGVFGTPGFLRDMDRGRNREEAKEDAAGGEGFGGWEGCPDC